jgi:hypothetical protein
MNNKKNERILELMIWSSLFEYRLERVGGILCTYFAFSSLNISSEIPPMRHTWAFDLGWDLFFHWGHVQNALAKLIFAFSKFIVNK